MQEKQNQDLKIETVKFQVGGNIVDKKLIEKS